MTSAHARVSRARAPSTLAPRSLRATQIALVLLGLASSAHAAFEPVRYTSSDAARLKDSYLLEPQSAKQIYYDQLGWSDVRTDPYDSYPYPADVSIDTTKNCYVEISSSMSRGYYNLKSWTPAQASGRNSTRNVVVYLTHEGPCGACSSLHDLAAYMKHIDMQTPSKRCGIAFFWSFDGTKTCLKSRLNLSDRCAAVWAYNIFASRKSTQNGGALQICTQYLGGNADSLDPIVDATGNPCDPDPATAGDYPCLAKINGQPACDDSRIWTAGSPFRINACLQADECRSGPVFKLYAGRTRRASGLISSIPRPETDPVTHFDLIRRASEPRRWDKWMWRLAWRRLFGDRFN
mmetsp:Transcript_37573/g.77148  ORF Transcript_37573/g.77148 Transcript_37573/m.77148 type:complete len:349 (-) Transcript_37573:80-1126(-)